VLIEEAEKLRAFRQGKVLVISIDTGIGSAVGAVERVVPASCIWFEEDPQIADAIHEVHGGLMPGGLLAQWTVNDFIEAMDKYDCSRLLLIATLHDGEVVTCSDRTRSICKLRKELADAALPVGKDFRFLFGSSAAACPAHREVITASVGMVPIFHDAADWGWTFAPWFFWGFDAGKTTFEDSLFEFHKPGTVGNFAFVLRWSGKQEPETFEPERGKLGWDTSKLGLQTQGYKPKDLGYAAQYPAGRLDKFRPPLPTRPKLPPRDAEPVLCGRWQDDQCREAMEAYRTCNMVLDSGGKATPLRPEDRARLLGHPHGAVSEIKRSRSRSRESKQRLVVSRSWHLASVTLLVWLILASPGAGLRMVSHSPPFEEQCEVAGGMCDATPEFFKLDWESSRSGEAAKIFDEAVKLFPADFFPSELVADARARVAPVALSPLLRFDEFFEYHKAPFAFRGPDIQALWRKANTVIGSERQNKSSLAQSAPPQLFPHGIGMEGHIKRAIELEHPFAVEARMEFDLEFVIEALAETGTDISLLRNKSLKAWRKIVAALSRLDSFARNQKHTIVEAFPGLAPMTIAFAIKLLKWPDESLPWCCVNGFPIVGVIPPTGVFRPVDSTAEHPEPSEAELLGDNALAWLRELKNTPPSRDAQAIFDATMKEVGLGLTSSLLKQNDLDSLYGAGNWRALARHIVHQNGNDRPIDDAKRNGDNACTDTIETITCVPPEFLVLLSKRIVQRAKECGRFPSGRAVELLASVEDWYKGYRQLLTRREHMKFAIASFKLPVSGELAFTQLFGMPFGLKSAVLQFNRPALLLTAVARRMTLLATGHFYDDNTQLDLKALRGQGSRCFKYCATSLGVWLSPEKAQGPSQMVNFLGHLHDFSRLSEDGKVIIAPKLNYREKFIELVQNVRDARVLTSGEASKLRGRAMWLDTGLSGRLCRGALSALSARQYYEDRVEVTQILDSALNLLQVTAAEANNRILFAHRPSRPPIVLWTDAMAEGDEVKLGLLLFTGKDKPMLGAHYRYPAADLELFGNIKHYSGPAELFGAPLPFGRSRSCLEDATCCGSQTMLPPAARWLRGRRQ